VVGGAAAAALLRALAAVTAALAQRFGATLAGISDRREASSWTHSMIFWTAEIDPR
jgi:hypothetical protein